MKDYERGMRIEQKEPMTYESFKEKMDYFLDMLREPNLTEDTKQMVNKSMQLLLYTFNNPVMVINLFDKEDTP